MKSPDKICFVSVDVEHDVGTGEEKEFRGISEMEQITDIFSRQEIPATFFVTGGVFLKFEDEVRKWSERYEIASHSYSHVYFNELSDEEKVLDIKKSLDLYSNVLSKSPKGFRAPSHVIDELTVNALKENGFLYDSSIVPHYPPFKKYRGYKGSAPKKPYNPGEGNIRKRGGMHILEIPVAGQIMGIPLAGVWIRKLPHLVYKILFSIDNPKFVTLSMHSWDGLGDGDFYKKLENMILLLRNKGYTFKTGEQIYRGVGFKKINPA